MGSSIEDSNVQGTLLITALERKPQWTPDHTILRYPAKDWRLDGYRSLSYIDCVQAVDRPAYWLDDNLAPTQNVDTVAYLGPNDLRYALLLFAIIKTRRKLLVLDGRVAEQGLSSLLARSACTAWIYAEDGPETPAGVTSNLPRVALPSVDTCVEAVKGLHRPYPYKPTWNETVWDEVLIIHTSGTTGDPKPIFLTNGFLASQNTGPLAKRYWPRNLTSDTLRNKAILSLCPAQWVAGIALMTWIPCFHGTVGVITPPDVREISPPLFAELSRLNIIEAIASPPHTIVQLWTDARSKPLVAALDVVAYLGADLDRQVGNDLAQQTRLLSLFGSTETGGQVSTVPRDRSLWYTHAFLPEADLHMEKVGQKADDDLHELIIERPSNALYQSTFYNPATRHAARIETHELYAPVPDLDGSTRWRFVARKDDMTKLSWLAKFHAQDIESQISSHPDVAGVFVGGEGRPVPYVILETKASSFKHGQAWVDEVYETVIRQANSAGAAEIQIPHETVLLATDKPLARSAKMTLRRKNIEQDFAEEIESAYAQFARVEQNVLTEIVLVHILIRD